LVVDPEKQPPEMRRLGINVAKLETVAMESLSSFFEDPSKPKNEQKKYILKELFKLAKMEEKYLRNEIGRLPGPALLPHVLLVRADHWSAQMGLPRSSSRRTICS
jgi:hypothetical protein